MHKLGMILLSTWLVVATVVPLEAATTAKVTVQVVDEDHVPLSQAGVDVWFSEAKSSGKSLGWKDVKIKGLTDNDGLFTAEGGALLSQVTTNAKKRGYYESVKIVKFTGRSLLNRWEPWNPTVEVVLKKKRNPVGMYVKGTDWIEVPTLEKPVGYDLKKGDWVAPYGTGMTNDFIFTFWSDIKAYREYDLKMTMEFSNKLDGIQKFSFNGDDQSYFKWPFEAPVDGYQIELIKEIHKIPGKTETNIDRTANYIFRVRTQTDERGNIVSAKYGKVSSEFEMSPEDSKFLIRFHYYFNPDGTRNLEEDPEKNLFKKK